MPCQTEECQFQFPDSQLLSSRNVYYCIFHSPEKLKWSKEKKENFNEKIFEFIKSSIDEKKLVNLSNVLFPGIIDFSDQKLLNISFKGAKFTDSVYFVGTQFKGKANFNGASFSDTANFSRAIFTAEVSFKNVWLSAGGDFENTIFYRYADFQDASFRGPAFFLNAKFDGYSDFQNVNFLTTVNFSGVKFIKKTFFLNADFGETVEFIKSRFSEAVEFSKIIKGDKILGFPEANFNGALFCAKVSFSNRKFLASTNFENCTFVQAPNFHNCELHQDTVFPPERFFKDTEIEGAVSAYRTLKLMMGNVQAHREQGMFYALEQKSLRNDPEVSKTAKLFSWLYEKTADYGQSMGKPLAWLGGVIGGFFVLYYAIACIYANQTKSYGELVVKTLGFSFKQAFQPFYVLRQPSLEWITDVTGVRLVKALATLESLFILGLFALFLLCVRWNFKRG